MVLPIIRRIYIFTRTGSFYMAQIVGITASLSTRLMRLLENLQPSGINRLWEIGVVVLNWIAPDNMQLSPINSVTMFSHSISTAKQGSYHQRDSVLKPP